MHTWRSVGSRAALALAIALASVPFVASSRGEDALQIRITSVGPASPKVGDRVWVRFQVHAPSPLKGVTLIWAEGGPDAVRGSAHHEGENITGVLDQAGDLSCATYFTAPAAGPVAIAVRAGGAGDSTWTWSDAQPIAVAAADPTPTAPPLAYTTSPMATTPDQPGQPDLTIPIDVFDRGTLDSLAVRVQISKENVSDLGLDLVAPSGKHVRLRGPGEHGPTLFAATFGIDSPADEDLGAFRGEALAGRWSLVVSDGTRRSRGLVSEVTLLPVVAAGTLQAARTYGVAPDAGPLVTPTPFKSTDPLVVSIPVADAGAVDSVLVRVDIAKEHAGDVGLELVSPSGKRVRLRAQGDPTADARAITGVYGRDLASTDDLGSLAGEPLQGTWQLVVTDGTMREPGIVRDVALIAVPRAADPSAPSPGLTGALGNLGG